MRAIGPKVSIATVETSSVPAFAPVAGNAATALAHRLTDARDAAVVAYASEAGQFQKAGFPTVICGPGSIEQAHKADEFVTTEQVDDCMALIRRAEERGEGQEGGRR